MTAVTYHVNAMSGVMLLALPLWLLVRTLWLVRREQAPRWGREILLGLFVLFLLGLASQTLDGHPPVDLSDPQALWARALQRWENRAGVNLTPGATVRAMLEKGSRGQKAINLAGNLLIFLPMGLLPPLLWKRWRHLWAAVSLSAGASLLIEALQLFVGRSVDVDDLILNTLGGLMGYLLFCSFSKICNRFCI